MTKENCKHDIGLICLKCDEPFTIPDARKQTAIAIFKELEYMGGGHKDYSIVFNRIDFKRIKEKWVK